MSVFGNKMGSATPQAAPQASPGPAPARPTTPPPAAASPAAVKTAPTAPPAKKEVDYETIAKRAYEISQSGSGGSSDENWHRAERELRGNA